MNFNFSDNKISIGTDLVEIGRFKNVDSSFLKKVFTEKEVNQCKKKINFEESLAGRFSGKEAVKKTIKENIDFNKIEITSNENGAPVVNILNKQIKKKYKIILSISHTAGLAHAVCLTFKV
ncbi:MAG: holo-ACP synthase [Candidatus Shapirobacteria bacterium]|jgi:holo-[acyl-carrier protein] synthase